MVSLSIPDLPSLQSLAAELKLRKIPYALFYEPDISAETALCTSDAAAPLLSGLPLALKNTGRAAGSATSTLKPCVAGSRPVRPTKLIV